MSENALKVLIPFAIIYSYETVFSALAAMKSKYHALLDDTRELRAALLGPTPHFVKLCAEKKYRLIHLITTVVC